MNQHLAKLNLTEIATLEDIKKSYRELALKYHPDHNKYGEEEFKSIKFSYEWLMKNHKPKKSLSGYVPYYAVLNGDQTNVTFSIYTETDILETGIHIYLIKGMQEYRIVFDKGTELPKTVLLTNIPGTVTLKLKKFEPE